MNIQTNGSTPLFSYFVKEIEREKKFWNDKKLRSKINAFQLNTIDVLAQKTLDNLCNIDQRIPSSLIKRILINQEYFSFHLQARTIYTSYKLHKKYEKIIAEESSRHQNLFLNFDCSTQNLLPTLAQIKDQIEQDIKYWIGQSDGDLSFHSFIDQLAMKSFAILEEIDKQPQEDATEKILKGIKVIVSFQQQVGSLYKSYKFLTESKNEHLKELLKSDLLPLPQYAQVYDEVMKIKDSWSEKAVLLAEKGVQFKSFLDRESQETLHSIESLMTNPSADKLLIIISLLEEIVNLQKQAKRTFESYRFSVRAGL